MKDQFAPKASGKLSGFGEDEPAPDSDSGALAGSALAAALKSGDGAGIWSAFQALCKEYEASTPDEPEAPPMDDAAPPM